VKLSSSFAAVALAVSCWGCDDPAPGTSVDPPPATGVPATPAEVTDPDVAYATQRGRELFFGRGACSTCHKADGKGAMVVGPNLGIGDGMKQPFAKRASSRRAGLSAIEYAVESIVDPDAFVVESYPPGKMKKPEELPTPLSDADIVELAAFVATQGAEVPLTAADLDRARAVLSSARAP
jgi:mono/diheme cytochrome c family protein